MKADIEKWAASSLPNQKERAKFPPPKQLHPIPKGKRPFQEWVLDTMPGLSPPGPGGETTIAIAVDTFTKWIVAAPLPNNSSATITAWFH